MKVVFFGTPQFAAEVLQYLLDHHIEIAAVVTRTDKPKGRSGAPAPTPVKEVALAHNLPLHQPVRCSTPEFVETLAAYHADLFVVVAYGEIVKESVLAIPQKGCINVHASLLPKYRGAAPIHRSIIHGDTETGVCIMHMVKEMDAGDVLAVAKVPIGPEDTCGEVEMALRKAGAALLLDVIHRMEKGPVDAAPQDTAGVTFAKKIELEECGIDWTKPANEIHNLVRGTNPQPGAWCMAAVHGMEKRLKVLRTKVEEGAEGQPGSILTYGKNGVVIACGQGAVRLLEIKLEGKKAMPAEEMVKGIAIEQISFVGNRGLG